MSPVTIGELNTEVAPDTAPEPERQAAGQEMRWDELDRARRAHAELTQLRARTCAEGFDA